MQSLAVNTANIAVIRVPAKQTSAGDNVDAVLNELVSQLWATYRDMGRISLH